MSKIFCTCKIFRTCKISVHNFFVSTRNLSTSKNGVPQIWDPSDLVDPSDLGSQLEVPLKSLQKSLQNRPQNELIIGPTLGSNRLN